jgi:hypothetical protein
LVMSIGALPLCMGRGEQRSPQPFF